MSRRHRRPEQHGATTRPRLSNASGSSRSPLQFRVARLVRIRATTIDGPTQQQHPVRPVSHTRQCKQPDSPRWDCRGPSKIEIASASPDAVPAKPRTPTIAPHDAPSSDGKRDSGSHSHQRNVLPRSIVRPFYSSSTRFLRHVASAECDRAGRHDCGPRQQLLRK